MEMSQDELAKRLGYKSRSSINNIERDASGLPKRKIADIAKALQTTPGDIMGWVNRSEEYKRQFIKKIEGAIRHPLIIL